MWELAYELSLYNKFHLLFFFSFLFSGLCAFTSHLVRYLTLVCFFGSRRLIYTSLVLCCFHFSPFRSQFQLLLTIHGQWNALELLHKAENALINQQTTIGNTLLERVIIKHPHSHHMKHLKNMNEVLCMLVTTVVKSVISFLMALIEMSLLWQLNITKTTQLVINLS